MKLNADLGEGQIHDNQNIAAKLAPHLHMAGISCLAHAGDEDHVRETIEICLRYNVEIGAHPSYEDRHNFGRVSHNLSHTEIRDLILRQWERLEKLVTAGGGRISFVKPHGALYNDMVSSVELLNVIYSTLKEIDRNLPLVSQALEKKEYPKNVITEAFIDRRYASDGTLHPRSEQNAVITSFDQIESQLSEIIKKRRVPVFPKGSSNPIEKKWLSLDADTLCIHGDNSTLVANIDGIKRIIDEI